MRNGWLTRVCALVLFVMAVAAGGSSALAAPPPYDHFHNAAAVGINELTYRTNIDATKQAGEPDHGLDDGGKSVWFKLKLDHSTPVTIDTYESNFDTLLAVYTGSQVDALTLVAQNDDAPITPYTSRSLVKFQALAGVTYYIAVDGYSPTDDPAYSGTIGLRLADNDNFANAGELVVANVSPGNNITATNQSDEFPPNGTMGNSVWWTFRAAYTGSHVFSTEGSDFDTALTIYTGSTLNTLTEVAHDNDGGANNRSRIVLSLSASQRVYIAVRGSNIPGDIPPGNIALSVYDSLSSTQVVQARTFVDNIETRDPGFVMGTGVYRTGTPVTLTAVAAPGYIFDKFTDDATEALLSASDTYTFTPSADTTVRAQFVDLWSVTTIVSPPGSGTASPVSAEIRDGQTVTFAAAPATGYHFVNWTSSGVVSTDPIIQDRIINHDTELTANFALNTYALGVSATTGGSATGGGTFAHGANRTVTATAASGYDFVNWTEGGTPVSTSASYSFTFTGARTLVANFAARPVITVSALPVAGGTVVGGGQFPRNSTRTVTATVKPGYEFVSWTEGVTVVSPIPVYTFTLTANRALRANFRLRVPKNDLLVDRGATGTWLFKNNATWLRIHTLSPNVMVVGDLNANGKDDALLSFIAPAPVAQRGLWARLDTGAITKIHPNTALKIAVGDVDNNGQADVIATFQTLVGTFQRLNNAGAWVKIHPNAALDIATGDLNGNKKADVLITLATGVWARYDNAGAWIRVDTIKPLLLTTSDTDANGKADLTVGRAAAGIFVRLNDAGAFAQIHAGNASLLSSGDPDGNKRADTLMALPNGLWMRNSLNGVSSQLNALKPTAITAADLDRNGKDEIVAIFPAKGLQARMNNTAVWRVLLATPQPEAVLATGVD